MHRRPVYIYFLNVPSFSSRYFNKIKRTSRLGRLLALSLEILSLWASCSRYNGKLLITQAGYCKPYIIIYRHNSWFYTDGCWSLLPLKAWCTGASLPSSISYFSTKTYAVSTHKIRTVSMRRFFGAPKKCLEKWVRKQLLFYAKLFCLSVISNRLFSELSTGNTLFMCR